MVSKPAVKLPNATIIGAAHPPTPSSKPLQTFNRISYAKAPRLKAPTLFTPTDTIDASTLKSACVPSPIGGATDIPEDTLTLNITRPATCSPGSKLPVVMYLHGGGFNFGSPADAGARGWVGGCAGDIIVVSVAYRLGALGFPGDGDVNLGLRDQRVAMEWIHTFIGCFGGDVGRVVMLGVSAGGHSAGHYILSPPPLLPLPSKVILESASPTSRSTLSPHHPRIQSQSSSFKSLLPSSFSASLEKVLDASIKVWGENMHDLTWPWQPLVSSPTIPDLPLKLWQQKIQNVPDVLTGFCRTEGNGFIQPNHAPFRKFWKTLVPNLPMDELEELYPEDMFRDKRERLYTAYGDYAYKCPVVHTAHMISKKGGRAYVYEFAAQDGVKGTTNHCTHGGIVRGFPNKPGLRRISAAMKSRWEEFITGQLGELWPVFDSPFMTEGKRKGEILVFGEGNDEQAGGRSEGVPVGSRVLSEREKRVCAFWWGVMEVSEGMGERGVVREPY